MAYNKLQWLYHFHPEISFRSVVANFFISLCPGNLGIGNEVMLMLGNWRASEASETLFTHVYGISRYIYKHLK